MKGLPISEQPYEKCEKYGPEVLSDGELLSVVIRTGRKGQNCISVAQDLLKSLPGGTMQGLFQVSMEQLCDIKGIGRVKAIQLLCLTEITRRMMQYSPERFPFLCEEPEKVAAYVMPRMRFLEREQVRVLILDGKNALVKEVEISNGSFNAAMASPREVFYYALKHKAVSIILVHNHPSGNPTPSREDLTLTRRIADTGKLIGIPLLDHIVIGNNCYVSIKEKGYL